MASPCWSLLEILVITRESPSIVNGVFFCCKDHDNPLMSPYNSAKLLVLVPMLPKKMLRTMPLEFLMAPPNPVGHGFPFAAPSKLILKDPVDGNY